MPAFKEMPVDDVGKVSFYTDPDAATIAPQSISVLAKTGRDILRWLLDGSDAGVCDVAHVVAHAAKVTMTIWLDDGISEGCSHYLEVDFAKAGLSPVLFGDAARICISFLMPEAHRDTQR